MTEHRHERRTRGRCALTGIERPIAELMPLDALSPGFAASIRAIHPELAADALISRAELARLRDRHIRDLLAAEHGEVTALEEQVAASIANADTISSDVAAEFAERRTLGERLSDGLALFGGSWTFIIFFAVVMAGWMTVNVVLDRAAFDPYPYILLNLVLSCLAAIQAPIIMMSQKRQETKDRLRSESDYRVNLKAELEIRHLHEKLDHLLLHQWQRLAEIQEMQVEIMQDRGQRPAAARSPEPAAPAAPPSPGASTSA
jgi:uncharacterized membrane protein